MAIITPTIVERSSCSRLVTWETITDADTGGTTSLVDQPETRLEDFPDKTVSCSGTFTGSHVVALEGSNDGVNFFQCYSLGGSIAAGDAISFSGAGSAVVAENCREYRIAQSSGSSGADADVVMLCAK